MRGRVDVPGGAFRVSLVLVAEAQPVSVMLMQPPARGFQRVLQVKRRGVR